MTHSKAVMILDQLVPSINSSGDPAGVFVKYARDNNLAPAELERLCQLFNTAKAVTHMQKSASRGSNHMVLPVEDIVAEYTTHKATGKGKHVKSAAEELSYDPFMVPDVQKYLDNGGELVTKTAGDNLRWDEDAFQMLLKMANEQEAKEKQIEDAMFLETVSDLHENTIRQSWKLMDKLAMHVVRDEELVSKLEKDSLGVEGHNKKALDTLCAWMDKYHSATPFVRFDMTKAASVRLTRDTTGLLNEVNKLQDMLTTIEECDTFIKSAVTAAPPGGTRVQDDGMGILLDEASTLLTNAGLSADPEAAMADAVEQIRNMADLYEETAGDGSSAADVLSAVAGLGIVPLETLTGSKGKGDTSNPPNPQSEQSEKQTPEAGGGKGGGKPPAAFPQSAIGYIGSPSKETKEPSPWKPVVEKVDKVVDNVGRSAGDSLAWLKDKLTSPGNFDQRRYKLDTTRNAVRDALNLQRAIVTDPILSEADPARLVSLYNSLSAANPEVMSDPNLLTYTLREAMQYDGVAPHTYEQLVGIDKSKSEATKNRNAAIDTEYKIN